MKHQFLKVTTATLLLAGVAVAQVPKQQPPPKYLLELNNASVDDALIQIAHGGKVNIIADATDWPEPAKGKTITTSHNDSTVGWLFGVANEFDLTLNQVGLNQLIQMPAQTKNYVLWREPDVEPILQQARQATAPIVREEAGAAPLVRPEGIKDSTWNTILLDRQREQAGREVAAWLTAQGVEGNPLRSVLSYPAEQLPEPLRNTLRQLARASSSNTFVGMNGVKTTVMRKLEDEAWKDARLRYLYNARERYGTFYIEIQVDGEPESIDLKSFYPPGEGPK